MFTQPPTEAFPAEIRPGLKYRKFSIDLYDLGGKPCVRAIPDPDVPRVPLNEDGTRRFAVSVIKDADDVASTIEDLCRMVDNHWANLHFRDENGKISIPVEVRDRILNVLWKHGHREDGNLLSMFFHENCR